MHISANEANHKLKKIKTCYISKSKPLAKLSIA